MISVRNLEKRYGDLVAVDGVSFEVQPGEIVGLLGHNGAGKTTIMKILTGYLEPTAGKASVGGLDVVEDRLAVQAQIGYLPESAPLYPEMLVQEYLLMMAELRGVPADQRLQRVSEAVRATGLEARLVQPIGTLSKGYKQRVGIAQAILHKPKMLVLDEPTNGLDPVQILEIRQLIQKLAQTTTILLSTHILQEIEAVCDRVLVLIDGTMASDSSLEALLTSNVVHVGVAAGAKGVEKKLGKVKGVEAVEAAGDDDGVLRFKVVCEAGARPAHDLVKVATDEGWEVAEVTPERPSLEAKFRDLMFEHVSRVRGEEAAA